VALCVITARRGRVNVKVIRVVTGIVNVYEVFICGLFKEASNDGKNIEKLF
jgi:hypothetical protein